MTQTGRNDPCPCGSGRKYKHCCLLRQRRLADERVARDSAIAAALDFLYERYSEQVALAMRTGFCSSLDEDEVRRLETLPEPAREMVSIQSNEWLLADGWLEIGDERRLAIDLVLGPGGPLLSVEERQWLAAVSSRRLGVYEVVDVRPGEGLLLRDLFRPRAKPVAVQERSAARQLVRWDVLGTRVVRWGDHHEITCAYSLRRDDVESIRRMVRAARRRAGRGPRVLEATVASGLIAVWLRRVLHPPTLTLIDAATGTQLLLVTDHYDILDDEALARRLAAQPDVEGDAEAGWCRLAAGEGNLRRTLLALNPKAHRRLEVFARSLESADLGREWLAGVAGDALRFRVREQIDPLTALARGPGESPRDSAASSDAGKPLTQGIHEQLYDKWADQSIPALGGRTPRQAVRSSSGRRRVVELLKSYEASEARAARHEGRPPLGFEFLWLSVGLSPPDAPR